MTYEDLRVRLNKLHRVAPDKLKDKVTVLADRGGDNIPFEVRSVEFNDGSVPHMEPYQLFLSEV